jgi:DNA-binding IclR family transcriptional regulator
MAIGDPTDDEAGGGGPTYRVRALLRGLSLLACFGPNTTELSLTALSERAGLDKVTAMRLLDCLVHERFLKRDEARGLYAVGTRILEVAAGYQGPSALVELADGPLHELARSSNQTASIGILDHGELLQIAVAYPNRALRRHTSVGERFPFHCTSLGKAILADRDRSEVDALARGQELRPLTARTIADAAAFLAELGRTRERGYAVDDEETAEGVRCLAAPIRDHSGATIAAINVSGPAGELADDQIHHYAALVRAAATIVSRRLGYRAPGQAEPALVASAG